MSVQVKHRRESGAFLSTFVGAQGELLVDTTNNRVQVHDGMTPGGFPAAKLSEIPNTASFVTSGANTNITSLSGLTTPLSPTQGGTGTALGLSPGAGFVNKLQNATMDVWQRGTAAVTVTTSGAVVADRWVIAPTGASVTVQQASGRGPTLYSLMVTGAASVTDVLVRQRIEAVEAVRLKSQIVLVQAQVYNNTGASITPALNVRHASAANNWSSPATDVSAVGLQPCANGSWTQVAYAFAASASSGNGLTIEFDFGALNTTSKSIQITECDMRVAPPGVAVGLVTAPPFPELRPFQVELDACERYLEKSYAYGTPAGTSGNPTGQSIFFMTNLPSATYGVSQTITFRKRKWTSPSIILYSPNTGASGKANDASNNADVSSNAVVVSDQNFFWQTTMIGANTGCNMQQHWIALAELPI